MSGNKQGTRDLFVLDDFLLSIKIIEQQIGKQIEDKKKDGWTIIGGDTSGFYASKNGDIQFFKYLQDIQKIDQIKYHKIIDQQKIQTKREIEIWGELVWIEDTVFICKSCNKRYDYAIVFKNDYENTFRCRKCNDIVKLEKQQSVLGGRLCAPPWKE